MALLGAVETWPTSFGKFHMENTALQSQIYGAEVTHVPTANCSSIIDFYISSAAERTPRPEVQDLRYCHMEVSQC